MEIPIVGVTLFFPANIWKLALERPCGPKLSLLALEDPFKFKRFVWHVYGSTSCLRIVDNVARAM